MGNLKKNFDKTQLITKMKTTTLFFIAFIALAAANQSFLGKRKIPFRLALLSEDDYMQDMKKAMAEFEKAGPKEKEAMLEEGKKAMKEEGMTEEEVEKAVGMFERGELDDIMKMKKKMEKKHGKKGGKKKFALLSEDKDEKKSGKKGGNGGKKFVMLSEDDDMEDMKKAMDEFEKAGPKEKEAMLEEGKKAMKEEGMTEEEVEKAVGMFERGELDDLMKMK